MEERLQQFRALVDAGSFTKAAFERHISQPALSNAVAKLERELKTPLIERGARPLKLTPAGKITLEAARNFSSQKAALKHDLAVLAGQKPTLKIGMIDSLAELFCTDVTALDELDIAYQVSLIINNSSALIEAVKKQELEYVFTVGSDGNGVGGTLIGYEPMLYVTTAQPPKTRQLISYNRESSTFRLIENTFRARQMPFEPAFYSTSPQVMLQLVLAGRGSAVLPFLTIKKALQENQLRTLSLGETPIIHRPIIAIATAPHASFSATTDTLKNHLLNQEKAALASVPTLAELPKSAYN